MRPAPPLQHLLFTSTLLAPSPTPPPDEVKKEWKKAAKGDAAVRLAAIMNEEGKQGVEAAFEQVGGRVDWQAGRM